MVTSGLLDTALWIHHLRFTLRQQACHFFQYSIQELVFGNGFYHFPFAEDHASSLAASQSHISIARFAWTIDDTAHDRNMNGSLNLGEPLLYFISNLDDIDFNASTRGTRDKGNATITQL